MTKNISINLLKHLSPSAFLEKYWGKQALFLQDAIDISGAELSKDVVFGLAKNENIESKIIAFIEGSQQTTYGPFNKVKHAKSSSLLIHQFNLNKNERLIWKCGMKKSIQPPIICSHSIL